MKFIAIFLIVVPVTVWGQRVKDSSSIFECTYKESAEKKATKSASLCFDLFEESSRDKGTLALRAEILRLFDRGYFPVSDVQLKAVGPYMGTSVRQVEGRVELSRDFNDKPDNDTIVLTFGGLLVWNPNGAWFVLDKPKKAKPGQMAPSAEPASLHVR